MSECMSSPTHDVLLIVRNIVQEIRAHTRDAWKRLDAIDERLTHMQADSASSEPFACDGCHGRGFHVVQMPGVLGGMQTRPVPCQACGATGRRDGQGAAWGVPDRFKEGGGQWQPNVPPVTPAPQEGTRRELCSHRWKTGDTSCRTYDHVCILDPGHDGSHHSQLGRDLP